jgi:hypothetical protein
MLKKCFKRFWCWSGFAHWTITSRSLDVYKDPKDPLQFIDFAYCKWCGAKGMIDSQGNLFW